MSGRAWRGSFVMKALAQPHGGRGWLNVKGLPVGEGRNLAGMTEVSAGEHFVGQAALERADTEPNDSVVVAPWSTRIIFPRATLTLLRSPQSGGGCREEMHKGN